MQRNSRAIWSVAISTLEAERQKARDESRHRSLLLLLPGKRQDE
jgi:hypothetical protein